MVSSVLYCITHTLIQFLDMTLAICQLSATLSPIRYIPINKQGAFIQAPLEQFCKVHSISMILELPL